MRRRRHNGPRLTFTAFATALALVLGGLLAHDAAGAPRSAQGLADETAAWVERTLRVPVERRPWAVAEAHELQGNAAFIRCGEPVVHAAPRVVRHLASMAGGRSGWHSASAARVLLHETLHRTDCQRLVTEHDRDLEEWAVDALALDLLQPWSVRFTGWGIWGVQPDGRYAEGVWNVRHASRWATGSRTWRDRAARLWRRALWAADVATRRAMVAEANRLAQAAGA